jgi:hypothetical protein
MDVNNWLDLNDHAGVGGSSGSGGEHMMVEEQAVVLVSHAAMPRLLDTHHLLLLDQDPKA